MSPQPTRLKEFVPSGRAETIEQVAGQLLRQIPPPHPSAGQLASLRARGFMRRGRFFESMLRLSLSALAVVLTVNLAIAATFFGIDHWGHRLQALFSPLGTVPATFESATPALLNPSPDPSVAPQGKLFKTIAISPRTVSAILGNHSLLRPRPLRPAVPAFKAVAQRTSTGAARTPILSRRSTALDTGPDAEIDQLAEALRLLQVNRDPQGALASLVIYSHRFPRGALRWEAVAATIDAHLALGQRAEAFQILETLDDKALNQLPRNMEFTVTKGELLGELGRCPEAQLLFDRVLERGPENSLQERALYGRALCEGRNGQSEEARRDLRSYLQRFPHGAFRSGIERTLRE